jgi:glycosyltransferase involved in cell wall biosynthesis
MKKVSTITSSYKSEKYLKGFLKSVKNQTYKNIEIVLDHNEPTDREINTIEKFNKKYNNIRHTIINKVDPLGISWNRCIDKSTGDYLCIWNVDDLRTPKSIELMANVLDQRKDIDIVLGKYLIVNKFKSKRGNTVDESQRPPKDFMSGMLLGPFFMFRKEILEKTGKFDEQFFSGNDFDLAMRLVRNGKYYCLDQVLGYYLNEGKGLSTKSESLQPLERTAVELRYDLAPIEDSLVKKASESYDIHNLYYDSKKISIDSIKKRFEK